MRTKHGRILSYLLFMCLYRFVQVYVIVLVIIIKNIACSQQDVYINIVI